MNILSCGNELKQQGVLLLKHEMYLLKHECISIFKFVQISNNISNFVLISFFEVYI